MTAAGGKSRQRELAVAALLSEPTLAAAAAKARVSLRTLKNWLKDDAELKSAYSDAKNELLDRTVAALLSASTTAVGVLVEEMAADKSGRIRAAVAVLANLFKGREAQQRGDRPPDPLLDLLYRATANGHATNGGAR